MKVQVNSFQVFFSQYRLFNLGSQTAILNYLFCALYPQILTPACLSCRRQVNRQAGFLILVSEKLTLHPESTYITLTYRLKRINFSRFSR